MSKLTKNVTGLVLILLSFLCLGAAIHINLNNPVLSTDIEISEFGDTVYKLDIKDLTIDHEDSSNYKFRLLSPQTGEYYVELVFVSKDSFMEIKDNFVLDVKMNSDKLCSKYLNNVMDNEEGLAFNVDLTKGKVSSLNLKFFNSNSKYINETTLLNFEIIVHIRKA